MCRRCDKGTDQGVLVHDWSERQSAAIAARSSVVAVLALAVAACSATRPVLEEGAAADEAAIVEEVLPPEAVQQFNQAVVHMSAGDGEVAEQQFSALAAAYPAYSGPLLNLGILHARAGRLDQAEEAILGAVKRNDRNAAAFNQLGIVYRRLGRFKDADEAYRRALQIDPDYAIAYLNLGVLCDLYLWQPQRALQAYERYLALAATPDEKVSHWVSELRRRISSERAVRTQ